MEMQLDGQLGAFFHILHGGRNGDGQIEFNSPAVDITQLFEVAAKSQYGPTKAWLAGSWAIQLASRQITVNVVAPGPTETSVALLFRPSGCSITGQRLVDCAGASL